LLTVSICLAAGAGYLYWRNGGKGSAEPTDVAAPAPNDARIAADALRTAGDSPRSRPAERAPTPAALAATPAAGPAAGQPDELLEPRVGPPPRLVAAETAQAPELDALPVQQAPSGAGVPTPNAAPAATSNAEIDVARRLHANRRPLDARRELNRLLTTGLKPAEQAEVRTLLTQIADETIFGKQAVAGDPLIELYTLKPGDLLVNVGKRYDVPFEMIMRINGISDASRIAAGQSLRVPRGPFHTKVLLSQFRLDLYLQDTYVRSFPVAVGAEQSTPTGVWKVVDRQRNPTYYPPPSSSIKRVVGPNDPENPLGGFWIKLEGVDGDAVGRTGFGIHGTNEPDSIGKPVSLGCVRLRNDDAAFLYGALLPGRSTVTTLP
jgi:LysM repeat protein